MNGAAKCALRIPMRVGLGPLVALVLAVPLAEPAAAQSPASLGCGLEPGPTRAVAAVLDGDTVRLDDGKLVRLAGILAPKAFDVAAASTWPPEADATRALAGLAGGRTIALAFAGAREDRHGRVLAHLFLEQAPAAGSDDEPGRSGSRETVWLQGQLVEAGHLRVAPTPGADACARQLLALEAAARAARRGLWDNAAYQIRPADRPTELARYTGSFQLVAGRIAKVGGTRQLAILDLETSEAPSRSTPERPPRTTRIVWPRSLAVTGDGRRLAVGSDVLVRGWIEGRGAPEIQLVAAEQLEVTTPAPHRQRARGPDAKRPAE